MHFVSQRHVAHKVSFLVTLGASVFVRDTAIRCNTHCNRMGLVMYANTHVDALHASVFAYALKTVSFVCNAVTKLT